MTPSGNDEMLTAPGPACPDALRWAILQAARLGDRARHAELMATAADVEDRALAGRTARAVVSTAEDRLFR